MARCNPDWHPALAQGGLNLARGELIKTVLRHLGQLTGGFLGSHYQYVIAFLVLILVLVLRPSGLLGERVG